MPFFDAGDARLFYTDEGAGEPLLLVHGWGADSHEWDWHVDALASRHRVLAVDLRGHGRSSAPAHGNTPPAMAADLARFLDGPVTAVGHSMGAQVVSILAVEHPELVRAVVAVDAGYGVLPAVKPYLSQVITALAGEDPLGAALAMEEWCFTPDTPAVVRTGHRRRVAGTPAHVLAQCLAGVFTDPGAFGFRPASEAYLAQRSCPVLSIWADPERARWEESLLAHPASRVLTWRGAGHYLHEERPDEFLAAVNSWLTEGAVLDGTA
jgi:pimeloyl-ACP methyl ester carboxylesterase